MIKKLKKAFTITELVIVIAVIAILAAVLIPTFSNVIRNANQSAALQTCTNALKDYQSIALSEGKDDEVAGTVFVSNNYVYTYINSSLQYVGELDDLTNVNSSGKLNKAEFEAPISGSIGTEATYTSITMTYAGTNIPVEDSQVTINISDLAENTTADTENYGKKVENVYFYTINVNNTDYAGFFTLENGSALYQTEGATYSRVYGYISETAGTITVSGATA